MREERSECTWLQCQHCGHIYTIEKGLPVEAFIVESWCPKCGEDKALNCGDDVYLYMDINIDPRNYRY